MQPMLSEGNSDIYASIDNLANQAFSSQNTDYLLIYGIALFLLVQPKLYHTFACSLLHDSCRLF